MKRFCLLLFVILFAPPPVLGGQPANLEEEVHKLASELRCVVCQNLSVADSPSEMAQQMRGVVREQLQQGKTPEEIKAYFVSKYGEWVLLSPSKTGFSLLVWVLPFVALAAGLLLFLFVIKRWVHKKDEVQATVDPSLVERVRREAAQGTPLSEEGESEYPQSPLQQEQAMLYADLRELEFDYQAGKLSETDYRDLRQGLETQAAMVLREIESSARSRPAARKPAQKAKPAQPKKAVTVKERTSYKGWQIAAGGIFLLLFGLTIGIYLTKSLRPRLSPEDSVTGDFLTGTGPGGLAGNLGTAGTAMERPSSKDLPTLLSQGRAAYKRKELSAAIAAFKNALKIDPNQPEAHTYMGLILTQAGHADGALLAFNRALLNDPNFPLALWGKGMLLYRTKEDYPGARQTLEKLASIMPPGADRDEVQKTIAEIAKLGSGQKETPKKEKSASILAGQIQGMVSVSPKLKTELDSQTVLFIIARSANSAGGPPLAVKKVERPVFPVSYSLGPENVMMPGIPFSGKVLISARLDKDGNPMTREPGNLTGEYRENPVDIGSQKVDIVIDHMM